jgi:hypothetical protein
MAFNRGADVINAFTPKSIAGYLEKSTTPQNMRGIMRTAGTVGGGMVGAGSPMPGGTMIGAGLGSMAGNYAADLYDSIYQTHKATGASPDMLASTLSHTREALADSALTGATQVVLPAVVGPGKWLLSKLLRMPPNSKELLKEANSIGVDIGPANMPGSLAGRIVNIFGRMPIVGWSTQKAATEQAKQIVAAQNDLFGKIAGGKATSEISQEAADAGTKKFAEFATKIQAQTEHAMRVGFEAGNIVPTKGIKAAAEEAITKLEGLTLGPKAFLTKDQLNNLRTYANLPDKITTVDVKALDPFIESMIRDVSRRTGTSMPYLNDLRKAAIDAMRGVDHPAAKLMLKADADFKKGLLTFANETAKDVGKLDREVFATGKALPGRKGPEEMADTITSLASSRKVQEMRALVGDDPIKQAARVKLESAWQKAQTSADNQPFKWSSEKFNKELGLDRPGSGQYEALKEMLRGTGSSIEDITKLARVAESVATAPVADISTFMARASILKGAGSLEKAVQGALTFGLAGAATHGAGLIPTLTGMLVMNASVGSLMRPGVAEAATISVSKMATQAAKLQAFTHLVTSLPQDMENLINKYLPPEMQKGVQNAARPR